MNINIKNKTLMIGASGFIGKYLSISKQENLILTYYKNKISNGIKFDIFKDSLNKILKKYKIKQVMFIGGVVNFNKITENVKYAEAVNVKNMSRIIDQSIDFGAKVIFFSSESVFDGHEGNYKETSVALPKFMYGKQKLQIENYIKSKTKNYLIFRISKVYSSKPSENTLITNWLKQISNNETITIAKDNILTPIYIDDFIKIITKLINFEKMGVYNICSMEKHSRLEMFNIILNKYKSYYKFSGKVNLVNLNQISGAEELPLNTSLDYKKTFQATDILPTTFEKICSKIILDYLKKEK
ncbi:sugar nucleotide-binding protein [Pseudomonadota bacterium]|nr:sugar nucleotide-binding protein [Pseudomonadota bacterium]